MADIGDLTDISYDTSPVIDGNVSNSTFWNTNILNDIKTQVNVINDVVTDEIGTDTTAGTARYRITTNETNIAANAAKLNQPLLTTSSPSFAAVIIAGIPNNGNAAVTMNWVNAAISSYTDQDVSTTATPTFAGVILNGVDDTNGLAAASVAYVNNRVIDIYIPAQTVRVDSAGTYDYSVIQDAIDAITDAATGKRYVIQVYPGNYSENVVLGDYMTLIGMGGAPSTCEITAATGVVLTLQTGSTTRIENIKVSATGTAVAVDLPVGSTDTCYFGNCMINAVRTTSVGDVITIKSGAANFTSCALAYIQVGTTAGTNSPAVLHCTNAAKFKLTTCGVLGIQADADDSLTGVKYNSTGDNIIIIATQFEMDASNAAFTGTMKALDFQAASTDNSITGSHITLECSGAGGTGVALATAGNTTEIHSTGNRISVTGFNFNYYGSIPTNDSLMTHFDDMVAVDHSTGGGTVYEVHSQEDGVLELVKLEVSEEIEINRDLTSLAAGETKTAINVVADIQGSTGGQANIYDVAVGGSGSADVYVLGAHSGVGIIRQQTGTPGAAAFSRTYVDSTTTYTDNSAAFNSSGTDVQVFVNDDDCIFMGSAAQFSEVQFIWETPASVDLKYKFYFSVTGSAWTRFYPYDDTYGGRQNGSVRFDASDLTGWIAQTVDSQSAYWVKIQRFKNNVATVPTEDTILILAPTEYYWNSDAEISASKLTIDNVVVNANDISSSSGNLTLSPVAGSAVVIDGKASFDGRVVDNMDLDCGDASSLYT